MEQVDATGDVSHLVDQVLERFAPSPGMAGVEHEPDSIPDRLPQPAQLVESPGHGFVATSSVFDQDRHLGFDLVERLAPPVVTFGDVAVAGHMTSVDHNTGRPDLRGRIAGLLQDP